MEQDVEIDTKQPSGGNRSKSLSDSTTSSYSTISIQSPSVLPSGIGQAKPSPFKPNPAEKRWAWLENPRDENQNAPGI